MHLETTHVPFVTAIIEGDVCSEKTNEKQNAHPRWPSRVRPCTLRLRWRRFLAHGSGAISGAPAGGGAVTSCFDRCGLVSRLHPDGRESLGRHIRINPYRACANSLCRRLLRTVRRDHSHMGDRGRRWVLSLSRRSRHWRRHLAVPRTTHVHNRTRSELRTAAVAWAKP